MLVVVHRKYSRRRVILIGLALVLMWVMEGVIIALRLGKHLPEVKTVLGALGALNFMVVIWFVEKYRLENRALSTFLGFIKIGDSSLVFPQSVSYELGRYRSEGKWSGASKRSYRLSASFIPLGKTKGEEISTKTLRGPFVVTVRFNGDGLLEFPAVRFLDGPFKDVMVLFMTSAGKVKGSGNIEVKWENDVAQLSFKGIDGKVVGRVYSSIMKARKAKVYLLNRAFSENAFKVSEGIVFEFSKRLLPLEDCIVITYKGLTPREFLSLARKNERDIFSSNEAECLLGHGEYEIQLRLDVPWREDVIGRGRFEVVFPEGSKR